MKLSEFAGSISAESNNIKIAFGGEAGSGKTFTATNFIIGSYKYLNCKNAVLYLDTERGSKFMAPFFQRAGIECLVKQSQTLSDVISAFAYLESGQVDFIFIDSLSSIYKNFVEAYKSKNKVSFMSLLHWGRIIPLWTKEFVDRYLALNGHVVFTGRGGNTWTKDDDQKNDAGEIIEKGQMYRNGVKLKLPSESAYEPDFIVWMEAEQNISNNNLSVTHTAQVLKDRSTILDGKVAQNPGFEFFKPYVEFLKGLKKTSVQKESRTDSELIPSQADKIYWERKEKSEIFLDKIKTLFEKFGVSGTSKDAKQVNALIAEKVFGTISWREVESFQVEKLEVCHKNLEMFFAKMDESVLGDKDIMFSYIKNFQVPDESLPAETNEEFADKIFGPATKEINKIVNEAAAPNPAENSKRSKKEKKAETVNADLPY